MNLLQRIQSAKVFDGRFTFLCLLLDKFKFNHCCSDDRLLALKDKYKGKRCFIVGLGPSLTLDDLNLLWMHREYTFSMNKCFLMFDKTKWRPDCYFLSDVHANTDYIKAAVRRMEQEGIQIIYSKFSFPSDMPQNAIYYKANYTDAILKNSRNKKYKEKAVPLRVSTNAYDFIYDGSSCVHSIIQLAYYMGFCEIYLLGTDCGVASSNTAYSTLMGKDIRNSVYFNGAGNKMIDDYASQQAYIERNNLNLHIYNATRGGLLEVFPRKKLEDILI